MAADCDAFLEGQRTRFVARFTVDRVLTDPAAIRFKFQDDTDPATSVYVYGTDPELVKDGVGLYHVDVDLDEGDVWIDWRWESDGVKTADQGRFYVKEKNL